MSATLENLTQRIEALETDLRLARQEIQQADNLTAGLLQAMVEVLPMLVSQHPDVGLKLARIWQNAARDYQRAERTGHEPELYEARKMLANQMFGLGVFEVGVEPVRGQ